MSISIKQDFICARSVGPFGPPEEEKGVNTRVLPLPGKLLLSGCMESVRCRQPISTNSSGRKYSVEFVPLLFGGGLRHALIHNRIEKRQHIDRIESEGHTALAGIGRSDLRAR